MSSVGSVARSVVRVVNPVRAVGGLLGGVIGGGTTRAAPAPATVSEAQERAETRAEVQTREEMARLSARRRARKTGGLRLLMSPFRQDMMVVGQDGQTVSSRRTLGPGG